MNDSFEARPGDCAVAEIHHRDPPLLRQTMPAGGTGGATADATDRRFLCEAMMLCMTALEAGRCAVSQGNTPGLRGLARQLVGILGRIDAECRRLAERHAVPVAQSLDSEHSSQIATLRHLGGAAFEQMYLREFAMEAHLEFIRLCGTELAQGSDEGLRAAAAQWLQELRDALEPARSQYFAPMGVICRTLSELL